jgi:hypothetical protein
VAGEAGLLLKPTVLLYGCSNILHFGGRMFRRFFVLPFGGVYVAFYCGVGIAGLLHIEFALVDWYQLDIHGHSSGLYF